MFIPFRPALSLLEIQRDVSVFLDDVIILLV